MRLRHALAVGLCALGCSGPPGAGRQLGDELGTFRVAASETENDCGPGALGSSERFEFDMQLSRENTELFWGQIGTRLGADLAFSFAASVQVTLSEPRGAQAGCAIERQDRMAGQLLEDGSGAIAGLRGSLSFSFAQAPSAECSVDEPVAAGLARLPCSLRYELSGQRSRTPEPAGADQAER